jgi:hypothetical protein
MKTAVEWLEERLNLSFGDEIKPLRGLFVIAKETEIEQRGYTKADVIKSGEMGEINHHDTEHIVSYLDEAREINKQKSVKY